MLEKSDVPGIVQPTIERQPLQLVGIAVQSRPCPATEILSQQYPDAPMFPQLVANVAGLLLLPKGAAEQVSAAIPPKTPV